MGIRTEYEVRRLPDHYVVNEKAYRFVNDEKGRRNKHGELPQKRAEEDTQSKGGWLILVKGKPGHSFRVTSIEQAEAHKLKVEVGPDGEKRIVPRLIDDQTGEEVNSQGVPLSVIAQLDNTAMSEARRSVETDIDVNTTGDERIDNVEYDVEGAKHVSAAIEKLE